MPAHSDTADQLCKRREGVTEHPFFSTIALTLVAVIALLAVGASAVVWRIRSTGAASRGSLVAAIVLVATAAILWVIFVWPVYVD
jgi:hypothetical protein